MYFVSKIVLTFCKGIFFLVIDNFVVEGQEFAKILRSLEQEQFIRTVKGQNNFGNRMLFYIVRIE